MLTPVTTIALVEKVVRLQTPTQIHHDWCRGDGCETILFWTDDTRRLYEANDAVCRCTNRALCCDEHRYAYNCQESTCVSLKRHIEQLEAEVRALSKRIDGYKKARK